MSFEADLKSHLQSDDDVAAILEDRIFPMLIPEGQPVPAVTYSTPFGQPLNCLDGYTSGKRRIELQLDCWSQSYSTLIRLANAVRERMGDAAANFTSLVTEYPLIDDYEPDTKRYRRSIGVSCWYSE